MNKFVWIAAGVVLIGIVAGVAPVSRMTLDLTSVIVGLAGLGMIVSLALVLFHHLAPQRVVHVESSFTVKDPMIPFLGRYSVVALITVRETHKGASHVVNQRRVELAFRAKSRAEFIARCRDSLERAIAEQASAIRRRDPQAKVVVEDPPLGQLRELLPPAEG